jgi:signal transduction histidine kinase
MPRQQREMVQAEEIFEEANDRDRWPERGGAAPLEGERASPPSARSRPRLAAVEIAAEGEAPRRQGTQESLLANVPASQHERRLALFVVVLSTLGCVAAIPFVHVPLPKIPAFIPSYESALAINDLITAVLLCGQFTQLRSRAVLVLAAGYFFDALMIVAHALTFPGVFSEGGLLGAGLQSTVWLFVFWHGGFALFLLGYALLRSRGDGGATVPGRPGVAILSAIAGVLGMALALTLVATAGRDYLPAIMQGGDFSLLTSKGISPAILAISLLALAVLARRRRPAALDLWIMVVLCAWVFDVALSATIGSERFDLGWYAGRSYGLLAASFVLVILLLETNVLHRRLAAAHAELADDARDLAGHVRERTRELALSNEALKAEMARREQTEARLVQSQKMEAIGNLTGGLAHDFNNLLGIAILNLDMLRERTQAEPDIDAFAKDALEAALRGADLTRRLLAFARKQPLKPERIDVNELVGGITKLLMRILGEEIEIALKTTPDLWPAIADPTQLETALTNLANNARDAMPKGGRLTIATGNRHLDEDYASLHPEVAPGDHVMIEVIDTGTGMPPEVVARIFEPFFTTKPQGKGTGLGLSMVFGFVKQSGGHINVYSEPGIGTAFRLYLPRAGEGEIEERQTVLDAEPRGNGELVLIVEDNLKLRNVVTRQVTELGYRVLEAENAAAALALLEREPVELLFADVVMPGRLNGVELVRMVRNRWPRVRVVLTSGFAASFTDGSEELSHLLIKPYRKVELARALKNSLQG